MADFKVSQLPLSTEATPSDFVIINKNNNATHRIGIQDLIDTVPPTPGSSGAPGAGTITISQPGAGDQTFNVNQTGNTTITLMNDDTVVTPGDGALNIRIDGQANTQTGTYTANQENGSTITLPTIDYNGLSNKPTIGDGTITVVQPGVANQTFTVNQTGNTTITLKNDNTVVTPGNGALTIQTAGEGANSTGTFTANQAGNSTLQLPTIRYQDLSGKPSIPAAAGNGTITITQPGTTDQTFTVNQSGNTTIALKNDNTNTTYTANNGVQLSGTNFTADSSVVRTSGNQTIGGTKTFSVTTVCNQTLVAKNYRETVYSLPWSAGFALNPLNGETQIVTLGGTSTPAQSNWNDGESITLFIVNTGSHAIDWTTLGVVWAGGNAPELATTGKTVIQFWKSANSIYGALVGDVA